MNLTPLLDRIVIGNITSADNATLEYADACYGTVLAVGPGIFENNKFVPMFVQVNDKVLFDSSAGLSFVTSKQNVKVMEQSDILLIMEKE